MRASHLSQPRDFGCTGQRHNSPQNRADVNITSHLATLGHIYLKLEPEIKRIDPTPKHVELISVGPSCCYWLISCIFLSSLRPDFQLWSQHWRRYRTNYSTIVVVPQSFVVKEAASSKMTTRYRVECMP